MSQACLCRFCRRTCRRCKAEAGQSWSCKYANIQEPDLLAPSVVGVGRHPALIGLALANQLPVVGDGGPLVEERNSYPVLRFCSRAFQPFSPTGASSEVSQAFRRIGKHVRARMPAIPCPRLAGNGLSHGRRQCRQGLRQGRKTCHYGSTTIPIAASRNVWR